MKVLIIVIVFIALILFSATLQPKAHQTFRWKQFEELNPGKTLDKDDKVIKKEHGNQHWWYSTRTWCR